MERNFKRNFSKIEKVPSGFGPGGCSRIVRTLLQEADPYQIGRMVAPLTVSSPE